MDLELISGKGNRKNTGLVKVKNKQQNNGWNSAKVNILYGLPPALLVLGNLFLFGPATIFRGNTAEFSTSFVEILQLYSKPFILAFLGLTLLSFILPRKLTAKYVAILFALGLLLWLQGNFLVWDYGVLDGNLIKWEGYKWQGWVDISLWLLLLILITKYNRKIYKGAAYISLMLIFLQSTIFLFSYTATPSTYVPKSKYISTSLENLVNYSSSLNIIHIIFDSLQTDVFEEVVRENKMETALDGFVLFKENLTVSSTTTFSIPTIFSGKAYQHNVLLSSYIQETFTEKSFLKSLSQAGYEINLVPSIELPAKYATNYYRIPIVYGPSNAESRMSEAAFLMDLVLFRHVPHFLKIFVYNFQHWSILPIFSPKTGVGHFHHKSFFVDYIDGIKITNLPKAYHFIHLMPPHSPYVTKENCECAVEILPATRDNYKTEIKCILKLFIRLLEKLKDLNIYDSSFIVLQADHGAGFPIGTVDKPVTNNNPKTPNPHILGRAVALLCIKPQNSRGPLHLSLAKTNVADVAATILEAAGLENHTDGISAFAIDPTANRERWYDRVDRVFKVVGGTYDIQSWHDMTSTLPARHLTAGLYSWGGKIEFGFMGNAQPYQTHGWSLPEDGFTWTEGKSASLTMPIAQAPSAVVLKVNLMAFLVSGKLPRQRVLIEVNGEEVGQWKLNSGTFQDWTLLLPEKVFRGANSVTLTFKTPNSFSPAQLGLSRDGRVLGIAVRNIELYPVDDREKQL